ncbi:31-O-demethyl-FK506 methyltransferase [Raphidocelis subcapitata]|uniref:31-O-demethyl-FK506 methyltransferase n=1 Tax=Raphidocelis subcapitata TaxID=307507 RepID=A0A2V0PJ10_9CHLO|nr:31-O-demethyl-FK506 methyltransferase [Raphidocelis subcapitata]|eukprot:GBF97035.1 31-O-demethyl-FK506 methyltransferase [Raphidocelis subcapitata]
MAGGGSAREPHSLQMPNGITIKHMGSNEEILMVYNEHFEERQYVQNGIELRKGDTVVDVGAHVGLFSIYTARAVGASGRVLAVEPAPDTYACCVANTELNGGGKGTAPIDVVNVACGDGSVDTLTLTVYDRATLMNTVAASGRQEELMSAYLFSQLSDGNSKPIGSVVERMLFLLGQTVLKIPLIGEPIVRFAVRSHVRNYVIGSKREVPVKVVTLSSLFKEQGIKSVGLLKVDTECADLIVLQGIADEDWPMIRQVAMEVHEERFKEPVLAVLRKAGFIQIKVESSEATLGHGVYNLWATRG